MDYWFTICLYKTEKPKKMRYLPLFLLRLDSDSVTNEESKDFFLATLTLSVINFNPDPMDNIDKRFSNALYFCPF